MGIFLASVLAGISLTATPPSSEGVYSTELRRCVVFATTESDRLDFVRWMFFAMSAHPAVSDWSTVTNEARVETNQKTAALMERLLLRDCRSQTIQALKYEGVSSIEFAFEGVGEVAMGDLMSNPLVSAQIDQIGTFIDPREWEALADETGGRVVQ